MPFLEINLWAGFDAKKKEVLISKVTDTVVEVVDCIETVSRSSSHTTHTHHTTRLFSHKIKISISQLVCTNLSCIHHISHSNTNLLMCVSLPSQSSSQTIVSGTR